VAPVFGRSWSQLRKIVNGTKNNLGRPSTGQSGLELPPSSAACRLVVGSDSLVERGRIPRGCSVSSHPSKTLTSLSLPATFDLGIQNMGSDGSSPTGCDWHPNVADHERMAGILKTQLSAKLGW
jgi:hypothetical protein